MLQDYEREAIKVDLETKLVDIVESGVANINQYPSIAEYWQEKMENELVEIVVIKGV